MYCIWILWTMFEHTHYCVRMCMYFIRTCMYSTEFEYVCVRTLHSNMYCIRMCMYWVCIVFECVLYSNTCTTCTVFTCASHPNVYCVWMCTVSEHVLSVCTVFEHVLYSNVHCIRMCMYNDSFMLNDVRECVLCYL